ncbi:cell division protein FtsZ, partial [Klebsiella pneumoniae]|nr:cell division protein FtsZ [Klebsiella pneumoniae]
GAHAEEHRELERSVVVEFFAVNPDAQALRKTAVGQTIQIGSGITKGLGAGATPEVGRNAADEDREALRAALDGADM